MASVTDLPLEQDLDAAESFEVDDPSTGEPIARVRRMDAADTRRAIEAAAAALPAWRSLLARDRARAAAALGRPDRSSTSASWRSS